MNNNEEEPLLDDLLSFHSERLKTIYNNILEEAILISSNLLTNDHLGYENVFREIYDLVRDTLEVNIVKEEEMIDSNQEELEEEFYSDYY